MSSRPGSAASSAPQSARGSKSYDSKAAERGARTGKGDEGGEQKEPGLRERLRRAREERKAREAAEDPDAGRKTEKQKAAEARRAAEKAEEEARQAAEEKARQERLEEERLAAEREEQKKRMEEMMRQAEIESRAREEDEQSEIQAEPQNYWWLSNQDHKMNDWMEVGSSSLGYHNRHVRIYIHTTFKEFVEERRDIARHGYPELMHLCSERGQCSSLPICSLSSETCHFTCHSSYSLSSTLYALPSILYPLCSTRYPASSSLPYTLRSTHFA